MSSIETILEKFQREDAAITGFHTEEKSILATYEDDSQSSLRISNLTEDELNDLAIELDNQI